MTRPRHDDPGTGAMSGRARCGALPALASLTALAALLVLPMVALAVERTTVFSPAAGAVLDGAFRVIVEVDGEPGEVIERVEVQLNGPSNLAVEATPTGPQDVEGVQRWAVEVDPLNGPVIFSNGDHRLTARPIPSIGDPPPFTGHQVTLAVPISTVMEAEPDPEDGTRVLVSWFPVDVPDLLGYRVERRPDAEGGRWTRVAEVRADGDAGGISRPGADAGSSDGEDGGGGQDDPEDQVVDAPAQPGAYRYRVIVVRSDGADGEVLGASETRGVLTHPDQPQTFDPPQGEEPQPRSTPQPLDDPNDPPSDGAEPGDGDAAAPAGPVGRPGAVTPQPTTQPNTGTGQVTGPAPQPLPGTAVPPSTIQPGRPGRPVAPIVPYDDGIFETELPVAQGAASRTVTETETAFVPGQREPGGSRNVLREEVNHDGWASIALSLLLIVSAGHIRRFMGDASRG